MTAGSGERPVTVGSDERSFHAGGGFGTRRIEAMAQPSLTREVARRILVHTALFATIPLLSIAAVFYNTRLALYLCFLLLVVHVLPGRIDLPPPPDPGHDR